MNNDLNIDQTYQGGGDFLKADDLKKRRVNLTVAAAKLEELKVSIHISDFSEMK